MTFLIIVASIISNTTAVNAKNIPIENNIIIITSEYAKSVNIDAFIIPMKLDNNRENNAKYRQVSIFVNNRDRNNCFSII